MSHLFYLLGWAIDQTQRFYLLTVEDRNANKKPCWDRGSNSRAHTLSRDPGISGLYTRLLSVPILVLELLVMSWYLVRFTAQRFGNYAESLPGYLRAVRLIVKR